VVNDSAALGENNELTFVLDRASHRAITRVIDRNTKEVIMQIPAENVLRMAEDLKRSSAG
jgi:flagellar protein FlaG